MSLFEMLKVTATWNQNYYGIIVAFHESGKLFHLLKDNA